MTQKEIGQQTNKESRSFTFRMKWPNFFFLEKRQKRLGSVGGQINELIEKEREREKKNV